MPVQPEHSEISRLLGVHVLFFFSSRIWRAALTSHVSWDTTGSKNISEQGHSCKRRVRCIRKGGCLLATSVTRYYNDWKMAAAVSVWTPLLDQRSGLSARRTQPTELLPNGQHKNTAAKSGNMTKIWTSKHDRSYEHKTFLYSTAPKRPVKLNLCNVEERKMICVLHLHAYETCSYIGIRIAINCSNTRQFDVASKNVVSRTKRAGW